MSNTAAISPRARAGKYATLLLLALLVTQCVLARLHDNTSVITLLLKLLPMLAMLPGMLRHQPRAYIWLCFMLLLYFLVAVQHAVDPHATIYDYALVALVTFLFTSAMLTARWLARSPAPIPETSK